MASFSAPRPILILILTALGCLADPSSSSADQWTDVSGTKTIEARLLGSWGDGGVFLLPDGRRVAIPWNDLQAESRLRAQKLAAELADQRQARVIELAQSAKVELAPAPSERPAPPEAPAYEPLPEAADLQQTVQHVDQQLRNGHLRVLWDALPKKYQTDLEGLVVAFAGNMEPQLWQAQMAAARRVLALLTSRQNWILSHPLVTTLAAQTDDAPQRIYGPLLAIAHSLVDPQAVSLQRLGQGDLSTLIADRDQQIAGYVRQLQEILGQMIELPPPQFEVEMKDKTHGTVVWQLAPPPAPAAAAATPAPGRRAPRPRPPAAPAPAGRTRSVDFVLVEGRWIPAALASDWDPRIEAAKQKIADLPQSIEAYRVVVGNILRGVDTYLGPLEQASSREAFHAQMSALIQQGTVAGMQAVGGRLAPGGGPAQQPYGFGQRYGGQNQPAN